MEEPGERLSRDFYTGYYITKEVDYSFDEALIRVAEELEKVGFGVITEIDVRERLKKKLGIDFKKYKILGVCHPQFAYLALIYEDKIGTMLPCNVIVEENNDGKVEVSAVDPLLSMQAVQNERLEDVATELLDRLQKVIERV